MPIEVDYRFPASVDAARHARQIAIGQSAGTASAAFAHRQDALRRHLGEVIAVRPQPDGRQVATVAFPEGNVTGDLATLLTMILGKYSLAGPAKVVDLRLPSGYGTAPAWGAARIRRFLGVGERPLIMAIFKPALGLSAQDHAAILREVADAGLDVIKDDEILPDLPDAPTRERLAACRPILDARAAAGRPLLYALNLTGRADELLDKARALVAAGANAFLLNVFSVGLSVLESLARDPQVDVPIFAHPAFAGAWCAAPDHGLSYPVALGTLLAHAGADAVLYPAAYGNLGFSADDERAICERLRARGVLPVPSAGIHPGILPRVVADYGIDVALNAGTGIMEHPDGPGAGVRAFHEAWERHRVGESFARADVPSGPLRRALETWGPA